MWRPWKQTHVEQRESGGKLLPKPFSESDVIHVSVRPHPETYHDHNHPPPRNLLSIQLDAVRDDKTCSADTGAQLCILPLSIFEKLEIDLFAVEETMRGPCGEELDVIGH